MSDVYLILGNSIDLKYNNLYIYDNLFYFVLLIGTI